TGEQRTQRVESVVSERIADQRPEQRERQADRRISSPARGLGQRHRREHEFRRDRKDEGFDETQSSQIRLRARMRSPAQGNFVKRLEQAHQATPPSSGTKLTWPSICA